MTISVTQFVKAPHESVREFYDDVKNLKRISPPFPRLHIEADDTRVVQGREFRITLDFLVFSFHWNSAIERVVPGEYFVDTFRGSVFRFWKHTHKYESEGTGTRLTDVVECRPVWWFAPFAFPAVRLLFMYRRRAIAEVLG
ncbi:MAG: hypothetical protein KF749_01960 [Bacteroidetes bacterium]|nr:hypothetical protein [Bacteroidota bacterium]MCW5894444.1 hypothetical protein [Bacteroidota bacterium]